MPILLIGEKNTERADFFEKAAAQLEGPLNFISFPKLPAVNEFDFPKRILMQSKSYRSAVLSFLPLLFLLNTQKAPARIYGNILQAEYLPKGLIYGYLIMVLKRLFL